jgi:hypothetical protein
MITPVVRLPLTVPTRLAPGKQQQRERWRPISGQS